MPICFANYNENLVIQRISGSDRIKKHLENLGVIPGEEIRLINKVNKNSIIKIKGISLAISEELARRILV